MYRVGTDILEVSRIERALKRSVRFSEKVFTDYERSYIESRSGYRSAGGIFCAKEAVSKLLGTGIRGFGWRDIEVRHDKLGKPEVFLYGGALDIAREQGLSDLDLSISHSDQSIVAVAIGEFKGEKRTGAEFGFRLPKRVSDTHKGDYGKVGIVGGSGGMLGAVYMSSMSALRTGSGLVYSFVPEAISEPMQIKSVENIVIPLEDRGRGFFCENSFAGIEDRLQSLDVVAVGPGMGRNPETSGFLELLTENFKGSLVVDADGIYHLKKLKCILGKSRGKLVITPHMAEFANFLDVELCEIERNRELYAVETAKRYGLTVVLKGHETLVTDGNEVYANKTGNPGMATAGSGDVLTGIIASLVGQGIEILEAAKLGVYIHGLSGDIASQVKGEYGLLARDIIESIPEAIMEIVDD